RRVLEVGKKGRVFDMKKKHAKIVVRSLENLKHEWKETLQGKRRWIQSDEEIVFTSLEALARIFSKNRMAILRALIREKPQSIYELAKILNMDFKNVHTDVKLLAEVGLVELKKSGTARNGLIPLSKFSGFDLDLAA